MADADREQEPATEPIAEEEISEVATKVARLLQEKYIFPEVAETMASLLLEKNYSQSITDTQQYAQTLTEDLQAISNDKHLQVNFNPHLVQELQSQAEKEDNFGWRRWIRGCCK